MASTNATSTKLLPITSVNRHGSPVVRFQVMYLTDRWHTDPNVCLDREQANRRAAELKR